MVRVNNADPCPKMNHFSHPHELELWNFHIQSQQLVALCSCCKLPPSEPMYRCMTCNFFLHFNCAQYPQFITHPSHRNHTLSLLPTAAYPGGIFNCDGCNRRGNGFSYHCGSCEFDLHVKCASKPLKITLQFHSCQLELTFKNPYDNAKGFSCDICRKIGFKEWLYRCSACEFDVHMDCAAASPAPPVIHGGQPQFLLHGGSVQNPIVGSGQSLHVLQHHRQLMHSESMGAIIPMPQSHHQFQPGNAARPVVHAGQVVRPNVLIHSASAGHLGNIPQPNSQSGLMNSVIQGLVEGAAQGVGQSLVQGMIGGGNGGGGGNGNGNGSGGGEGVQGDGFSVLELDDLFEDSLGAQN